MNKITEIRMGTNAFDEMLGVAIPFYYLLDIAIHNKHLRVRLLDAPPGSAMDESGAKSPVTYGEEYAKLPLSPFADTKNISLEEFEMIARPIRDMGKNKQVRQYACVFYVKVWDLTSDTAKERWQQAEDVIKNSFYTYRVRHDPWGPIDAEN